MAQALAEQISTFEYAMDSFAAGSSYAAQSAYGYLLMMLELGSENSEALDTYV